METNAIAVGIAECLTTTIVFADRYAESSVSSVVRAASLSRIARGVRETKGAGETIRPNFVGVSNQGQSIPKDVRGRVS